MLSNVDLPHPDGPITATNSPVVMVKSTPRNARTGAPSDSNVLRSPCVSTTNSVAPSVMRQSPFHVVEHIDAICVHRRVPPFDHHLVEGHALDVDVQRLVRGFVDHDPARRPGEILQALREV